MTLTTTQQTAVDDYSKFLAAGSSYGESMRKAAKALGGTPCPTLLGALAAVHAEHYKCNYTWDGKGRAVFYDGKESTRETRNDAARKSWQRNVMVWFTPKKSPKAAASYRVDPALRSAAMDFLSQFKGDTLDAQIAAAKRLLEALK